MMRDLAFSQDDHALGSRRDSDNLSSRKAISRAVSSESSRSQIRSKISRRSAALNLDNSSRISALLIAQNLTCSGVKNKLKDFTPHPAFSSGRDDISSMRSIGSRARRMMSAGSSMRGARFAMQSRNFSSVFIFMYLHSLQRQLSVGSFIASNTGAQINSLPGHSFCMR